MERTSSEGSQSHADALAHRNDEIAAVRLAPELLSLIFLFVQAAPDKPPIHYPDQSPPKRIQSTPFTRIRAATHVCGKWRTVRTFNPAQLLVALDAKHLWTSLRFRPGAEEWDFEEEMLKRSKPVPLDLTYEWPPVDFVYVYDDLINDPRHLKFKQFVEKLREDGISNRIRSLCIQDLCNDRPNDMKIASLNAPNLEALNLTLHPQPPAVVFPTDTLRCSGKLTSLTMHECHIPWDASIYNNLTILSITLSPADNISLGSSASLDGLFGRMTRIRYIFLDGFTALTPESFGSESIILPSSLETFGLRGHYTQDVLPVALCIVPKDPSCLRFSIWSEDAPERVSPLFLRHTPTSSTLHLCLDPSATVIESWRPNTELHSDPDLSVEYKRGYLSTETSRALFEAMPELHSIRVHASFLDVVMRVLTGDPALLPNLTVLCIQEPFDSEEINGTIPSEEIMPSPIGQWLEQRKVMKGPRLTISIPAIQTFLSQSWVDELQRSEGVNLEKRSYTRSFCDE